MPKRAILAVAVLVVLATTASCEKTTPLPNPTGPLSFAPFTWQGTIPAEYGRLVAVTSNAAYPGWAQLWFEKPDSTIVAVFVDYQTGAVRDRILELPRS